MLYKFTIYFLILLFLTSPALAGSERNTESAIFFTDLQKFKEQQNNQIQGNRISSSLPHAPLKPRVEANWRASNDRSILMTEFWVPVAQNEIDGSVIYGDLRLMGDNASNREFNIGAGYRKMVETTLLGEGIAGAHVWYDRRFTKRDSKFNQVTAGMEWFGDVWDIKLNGYLPLNDSKNHTQGNPNGSGTRFAGNQIIVNTDQSVVEEALPGLDLELGWKVPFMDDFTDSTRIYVGGYHFEGDRADDVTGWRARIASDVTSDIQIGARFQRDDERGSQAFIEATIRFPFGNKQSYKQKGLRARLDESPERDIDIVLNEAVTDQGIDEILLNAATGTIQNVLHVDNTAAGGGDGSVETPFDTLAAAEGAAGTNDLIYLHRGDGTTTGQNVGITLNNEGQMLIGAGANFTYVGSRFTTSNGMGLSDNILAPADPLGAPVITNGAGTGVDVRADGTFLSGFTVDGAASRGVFVLNNSGATWTRGTTIQSTIVQNNTNHGFIVEATNAGSTMAVNFTNNIADTNGNQGIYVIATNGGFIEQANFIGNTAKNNAFDGFRAWAQNGTITSVHFTDNIADTNGQNGFRVLATSGGVVGQAGFTNNTSQNNTMQGFYAHSVNAGSTLDASYSNNTANNNGSHGFYASALNSGSIGKADFTGNTAQNNTSDGFSIQASGVGSNITNIDFTNNTADINGSDGFLLRADASGIIGNADFTNNIAKNNASDGFFIFSVNAGSALDANFTNNTADNNSASGFSMWAQDSGSINHIDFLNNTSENNTSYGFWVRTISDGDIAQLLLEDNFSTGNGGQGIQILDGSVAGSIIADLGGGAFGSAGNNRIFGNTGVELFVDLDGGNLKAENNWWGSATGLPGGELTLQDASTADTTPFLTSAP